MLTSQDLSFPGTRSSFGIACGCDCPWTQSRIITWKHKPSYHSTVERLLIYSRKNAYRAENVYASIKSLSLARLVIRTIFVTSPEVEQVVVVDCSKTAIEAVCLCFNAGKFVPSIIRSKAAGPSMMIVTDKDNLCLVEGIFLLLCKAHRRRVKTWLLLSNRWVAQCRLSVTGYVKGCLHRILHRYCLTASASALPSHRSGAAGSSDQQVHLRSKRYPLRSRTAFPKDVQMRLGGPRQMKPNRTPAMNVSPAPVVSITSRPEAICAEVCGTYWLSYLPSCSRVKCRA